MSSVVAALFFILFVFLGGHNLFLGYLTRKSVNLIGIILLAVLKAYPVSYGSVVELNNKGLYLLDLAFAYTCRF